MKSLAKAGLLETLTEPKMPKWHHISSQPHFVWHWKSLISFSSEDEQLEEKVG